MVAYSETYVIHRLIYCTDMPSLMCVKLVQAQGRKGQGKASPFAQLACHYNCAFMAFHNQLND